MAEKKFVSLHESYMKRYERGGFLVGDVFKFHDDYKSKDCYKAIGAKTKQAIDQLIDSGLHIRVINIKDTDPARYPANSQTASLNVVLDLALDTGGGRYSNFVSVPGDLGETVLYAPNLLPIPDAMRRKDRVTIKPEEAEETKAPQAVDNPERALPTQNTEIPCEPATPSMKATSYTQQYLGDLTKGPSAY
jgi:hypothetical protein|tara:strand:- start:4219 stop:4791 length:573 start_codon:yes stop_codon:yes gene_type:complete